MDPKDTVCCIHCGIIGVDGDDLQLVGQPLTALEARAATLNLHALLANIDRSKKDTKIYLYA